MNLPRRVAAAQCFHCGEALGGSSFNARINGRDEPVCCLGCRGVAELISSAGLEDYYRYRTSVPARPEVAATDPWTPYENADVAAEFIQSNQDHRCAALIVDGIRCSACVWLLDRAVRALNGVTSASFNAATGRAHVEWLAAECTLATVLRTIATLGYRPSPITAATIETAHRDERRDALKRLAVATGGMMQVMMFAVAFYTEDLGGAAMDASMRTYFRLLSLLITVPVVCYVGLPFLAGAWRAVRSRTVNMDLSVSVAVLLAFFASAANTFTNSGAVYFDSVTMFLFVLALGRFVELCVRQRTTTVTDALAMQLPAIAHRLVNGVVVDVAAGALDVGDRILIRSGEAVPADGRIAAGDTRVNEALLTGESAPRLRGIGDRLIAGSINLHAPVEMIVEAVRAHTVLSRVVALLQKAQAERPLNAYAADLAAAKFLRCVLLLTALTCGAWLIFDPSRAVAATIAVLVAACPCAFAIAMPAAASAATARLAQLGVLVTHPAALETLAKIDLVVFDKTGTLTRGELRVAACSIVGEMNESRCRMLAAALERASNHPIARAFTDRQSIDLNVTSTCSEARGVEGVIDGRRYRIGLHEYVAELRGGGGTASHREQLNGTVVSLGDCDNELAVFTLCDQPRPDSASTIHTLRQMGVDVELLSGDGRGAVAALARHCSIANFTARCSPERKLAHVRALQSRGLRVAMVGDGVNDVPVLGAADVSVAIGRGAALAVASAGLVLIGDQLRSLPAAIVIARRAMRVARQNLWWAAAYNLCALPLAAIGLVPPWLAALGMSVSSLAVVLNATRLLPVQTTPAVPKSASTLDAADLRFAPGKAA